MGDHNCSRNTFCPLNFTVWPTSEASVTGLFLRNFYFIFHLPHDSKNNIKSNSGLNEMGMFDSNNEMHIIVFRLKKGIAPVIVKIPKTNVDGSKMRYSGFILKKRKDGCHLSQLN